MNRVLVKVLCSCASGALLMGVTRARATALVTDHIINTSAKAQIDVPVTFGQIFRVGDVPRGATVTATVDGQPISLQVDSKAKHADGSLRHAVLTAIVPSLAGKANLALALSSESVPAATGQYKPVSLSELLATNYNATLELNIGGTIYTADARALLQTIRNETACKPWDTKCNLWLSGGQVSEWIVNGPVTNVQGKTDPSLRVFFAVRAYAGATAGTLGEVRTDVVVENSSAFAPQAQPQYTAALTSGTASYNTPELTQYAYTRWHKVMWWNNVQPQVYVRQDTQYIQASKVVSRYMALIPDEKFLARLRQSCAPLDRCDQSNGMGKAGAQAAIGPLPRWTSVYIVHPDLRAYRWMIANTDALGAYSTHYRDQQTGWPISIQKHPNVTIIDWTSASQVATHKDKKGAAYKLDALKNCFNNSVLKICTKGSYGTGNPNAWDNAHQPSGAYIPYMVTGDYYYMSELAFDASYNEIWSNENYRGYSKGLIGPPHSQVRGKAWVLREMADAAFLLPDHHPLKAEFSADVINSLADWNARYTNNPKANSLGVLNSGHTYGMRGGTRNGMAPWMHNFFTWSAGHAADLGFAGAADLRNWLAKFEIGLMTDWQANPSQGYCWLLASTYTVVVTEPSGKRYLPSFSDLYANTFPSLVGLACNSRPMVAALGALEKKPWKLGQMPGYPQSPTGYPANLQIGLAAAADSGLPKAHDAWRLFDTRSVKPNGPGGYNNYPNFAIIPRTVSH